MKSKITVSKPEPKALYRLSATARTISAVTRVAGGFDITADISSLYLRVGQVYRAETAATDMAGREYQVVAVTGISSVVISTGAEPFVEPNVGDTFFLLDETTPRVAADGSMVIDLTSTDLATETTLLSIDSDTSNISARSTEIASAYNTQTANVSASRGALVGGIAANSLFYKFLVDTDGHQQIDVLTSPEAVAQGSTTSGQVGSLIQGAVTTAAPSYSTGQTSPFSLTTGGALRTQIDNSPTVLTRPSPTSSSSSAMATAESTAYATNLVVKASAGRLYAISGYNSHTSDQFIQIHNTSSLPADASVPKRIIRVYADSNFYIDFGDYGLYCSTGITLCNSTTGPTKTIGAANVWFQADYT